MFTLYRFVSVLLSPLLIWRLHRAGPDHDGLPARRRERRGQLAPVAGRPVWVHAASVGEVNAAVGLINGLLTNQPDRPVLLTSFTVSGARQAARVFGDRVAHRFLPVDTPGSVRRWLDAVRPRVCIVVETEIWPELYEQIGQRGLPLVIVNARLSEKTMRTSRRLRGLYGRALGQVDLALCQTSEDADRFQSLGVPPQNIAIGGNLKFDNPLPADAIESARALRKNWGQRPVWVAGSTRPGEEELVLAAQHKLLQQQADGLLVLAPRHPERSGEVIERIEAAGLRWQRLDEAMTAGVQVVLVDRLGRLAACYAAAQACFVGASLVPLGGHNLLEPAAFGKPVLAGPHLDQQRAAADALNQADALIEVNDPETLAAAVARLWSQPEQALAVGRAALGVVESGRGALRLTLKRIERTLSATAG